MSEFFNFKLYKARCVSQSIRNSFLEIPALFFTVLYLNNISKRFLSQCRIQKLCVCLGFALECSQADWLETLRFVLNPLEGFIISVFALKVRHVL